MTVGEFLRSPNSNPLSELSWHHFWLPYVLFLHKISAWINIGLSYGLTNVAISFPSSFTRGYVIFEKILKSLKIAQNDRFMYSKDVFLAILI